MSKYLRAHGKLWIERVLTHSLSIIYPLLRKLSKKVFSVLFPFPLLDEIKVSGDSCLPHICEHKIQTSKNSRFCHRITELETLLGTMNKKWGYLKS